jgi:hypothetical protein
MLATALLAALYFGFLMAALIVQSREVRHPWLFLLRSFLPNWRFYSAPGPSPRLFVRAHSATGLGEWQLIYPRFRPKLLGLVFNPKVNLALAEMNLVDHLASDLNDCAHDSDVVELVSYQMVERVVRQALPDLLAGGGHFQFCLRAIPSGRLSSSDEDDMLMISAILDI